MVRWLVRLFLRVVGVIQVIEVWWVSVVLNMGRVYTGCGVGIEVLVLFIWVQVIMLFFIIIDGWILNYVGFYSIRLVSLFGFIELILLLRLYVWVGQIVILVMQRGGGLVVGDAGHQYWFGVVGQQLVYDVDDLFDGFVWFVYGFGQVLVQRLVEVEFGMQVGCVMDLVIFLVENFGRVLVMVILMIIGCVDEFNSAVGLFGSIILVMWSFQLVLCSCGLGSCLIIIYLCYEVEVAELFGIFVYFMQVGLLLVVYIKGMDFKLVARFLVEQIIYFDIYKNPIWLV